jgi:hypothetical protein
MINGSNRRPFSPLAWLIVCAASMLTPISLIGMAQNAEQGTVYVVIWFDVEDYFAPETDDPDKRAAEIATALSVPLTIKVVGEKARVLERRGRRDVIRAMAQHDIGYHSDWHSRPPSVAAYLRDMNWEEGVREFERREAQGAKDVQRIFGKPVVCYGQPGSSWAPQSYPALRKMGVRLYLDEASQVGLPSEQPFWFDGVLNVFNLRQNTIHLEFGSETGYQQTCDLFRQAYQRLLAQGGGTISIYYHPLEFIYRGFADAVNYGLGANTPSEKWGAPEKRTPEVIEQGYRYYQDFLRFVRTNPRARFVNGSDLLKLYADRAQQQRFTVKEIEELARRVQQEITFQQFDQFSLSAAETFALLIDWSAMQDLQAQQPVLKLRSPYGPSRQVTTEANEALASWREFQRALLDARDFLTANDQIPSGIWVDTRYVAPADFLATLGAAIESKLKTGAWPPVVTLRSGKFTAGQFAAEDSRAIWDWPIFPRDFLAPNIMHLARLQTWTIKPARLASAK